MGLRCEKCFEAGKAAFDKYAASRKLTVTVNDYEGKNKCGGCGKEKATKIISYS